MRATRDELPVLVEAGDATVRAADWGGMRVVVVSVPAGTDLGPLMRGLPDDRCQCPHWGYMVRGRLRVHSGEGEEELRGGDLFYVPPGHTGVAEEDTEFIEVSPPGPHQQFVEAARRNLAAMQPA